MMKRTAIVQNAGMLVLLAANTLQEHFKKQGYATEVFQLMDGKAIVVIANTSGEHTKWWKKLGTYGKTLLGLQVACCMVFEAVGQDMRISVKGVDYLKNVAPILVSTAFCWWLSITGTCGAIRQKLFADKALREGKLISEQLVFETTVVAS